MVSAKDKREDLEKRIMEVFHLAVEVDLELSEEESDYDIIYISGRLAKCSSYQEQLSRMAMDLTKIAIEVTKTYSRVRSLREAKERQLKQSEEYGALQRHEKTPWLQDQLNSLTTELEGWNLLKTVLNEVREAVADRHQTMKRLDSDLRLHAKLYETKVGAGAAPRPTFDNQSGDSGIMDIN